MKARTVGFYVEVDLPVSAKGHSRQGGKNQYRLLGKPTSVGSEILKEIPIQRKVQKDDRQHISRIEKKAFFPDAKVEKQIDDAGQQQDPIKGAKYQLVEI